MKRIIVLLFLSIVTASNIFAQKYTSENKKAIKAFEQGLENKGQKAIEYFEKAISYDSSFVEAYVAMAEFYADSKEPQKALNAYWKGMTLSPTLYPTIWYTMGEMEMKEEHYAKARECYNRFLKLALPKTRPELKEKAQKRLSNLDFIEECVKNPVPFKPENLGADINTENHEYFPSLTTDGQTLVFTRRFPRTEKTTAATSEEEDFFVSEWVNGQWTKAQRMPPPVNSYGNEGAQCISPDGKFLFFTGCSRPKGYGNCDLYMCEKAGNQWSEPQNLGPLVNTPAWESQPSISPDGKTLYFTSNRIGGKGGKDLWMSRKENDIWQEPTNLGDEINTEGDEISPFIHPDNQTLYFASDGHQGMGGLDIFYTRRNTKGNWEKPINMGCPINTQNDEMGLIVSPNGKTAYFSTDKLGDFGKLDIYEFDLYQEARPIPVSYLKGLVSDEKTGKKLRANFSIYNLVSGELVAQSFSDRQTGEFLISLPSGQRYALNVSAENYLFYSESFDFQANDSVEIPLQKNILLKPIAIGDEIVLRNIFFEYNQAELKPESTVELDKTVEFLQKNASIKVEISGHTDSIGTAEYNLQLSANRAKAVYEYLVQHGIDAKRLSYKGMGFQKPIDTNDTEKGRANNRRTEMKVMGK